MKLLEERPWPRELSDELARQLSAADPADILRAATRSPAAGRGFRPEKANLARFRRNLAALATANLSEADLDALRWCTVWKDIVCVLSVRALTEGFDALAAFLGGARLVVGMVVDPREEVRRRALKAVDALAGGHALPPVPEDPEAARGKLAETFEPFIALFSSATRAPTVTRIDRSDDDRERIRKLAAEVAALTAERAAESAARRDADRSAAEAARTAAHANADAAAAHAEAEAARAKAADAEAALARERAARSDLADELLRARNEARTLAAFRDECLRLRERVEGLRRDNDALRADLAALRADAERRASSAAGGIDPVELLRASVEAAPEPAAGPPASPRERLSAMCHPSPLPDGAVPLRLVVDGHNVLNVAPEYVAMALSPEAPSHAGLRADLQRRLVALADRLAPCEIDLHFDGPVDNLYRPAPGIRVRFSGGTGDHRADRVALDELAFYAQQGGAAFVTVTEDIDFADEARRLGSRTVRSGDFARLLFG